jgi:hypothetical protein
VAAGGQIRQIQWFNDELALARIGKHLPGQMGRLLAGLHHRVQQFAGGTARRQEILRQACVANYSHQQVIEIGTA